MRSADRIAYDIIVTLIGFTFVSLRLWVRYYVNRRSVRSTVKAYMLSDVFVVVSFVFAAAVAGLDIQMQGWKIRHIENKELGPEAWGMEGEVYGIGWQWLQWNFKYGYLLLLLAWISLYFAKGSFLLFYWMTARSLARRVYWVLIGVTACTISTFIVTLHLLVFTCFPVSRNWILSGHNCVATNSLSAWSTNTTTAILSSLHLSTHLALLIIGFLIVRAHIASLHQREWLGVTMLFGLGVLVFTAHCVRFAVQMSISTDYKGVGGSIDFNPETLFKKYAGGRLETWILVSSLAELHICLIAVSLPTLERWVHRRKVAAAAAAAEAGIGGGGDEKGCGGKWKKRRGDKRAQVFSESTGRMKECLPRPPPQAMSFHLSALSSFRSGGGGMMSRLSTGETTTSGLVTIGENGEGSPGRMVAHGNGSGSFGDRRSRDNKVFRVYGATQSVDEEFERRGSVKIMNAAGNF